MVDYPYILFILVLSFFTYMEGVHKRNEFYVISLWVVFFFIAFRSPTVGGDTENYYRFFEGSQNYYNSGDNRDLEPMFLAYNYFLGFFLARSGFLYMIANTIFCLIVFKILIDKFSSFKSLSVLLFFLICDYMIYFVALRQGLAIQIFVYGIICVLENKRRKWIIYVICSLVGAFVHTSIIIYSIVIGGLYFIYVNKIIYISLTMITFCIGLVMRSFSVSNFFELLINTQMEESGRYDGYLTNEEWINDSTIHLKYAIRPSLYGFLALIFLDKNQINHWFTKIYLVSICIHNLLCDFTMTPRLNAGFSVFSIIVMTWAFPRELFLNKYMKMRRCVFVLFLLFLLRSYILTNANCKVDDAKMHPYKTFLSY